MKTQDIPYSLDRGAFLISFQYRFESGHRLSKATAGTCMTPHGHSWHAKAIFGSSASLLNAEDMVIEFALLKKGWKSFIHETADHSFFHHWQDSLLPSLTDLIPDFRGLPFPGDPTTELVAALFFAKISAMHEELCKTLPTLGDETPLPKPTAIVIQETLTNTIELQSGPALQSLLNRLNENFEGWWQVADPLARHLQKK